MKKTASLLFIIIMTLPISYNHLFAKSWKKQLLEIFHSSPQERLKKTRWDQGSTTVSNESRLELFYPYVFNAGGGYVGIGGTQNFLLASWADAQWVWLMDFTTRVVAANRIQIAFLKHADTPQKFLALWQYENRKKAQAVIIKYFNRREVGYMFQTLRMSRKFVDWRFRKLKILVKKRKYKIWLNEQYLYDRIRNLALENRIIALRGNLYGHRTMRGIGARAKKMGVVIKTIYLSNAEEYMVRYTSPFRKNILSLPVNKKSWLFRTVSARRWAFPWSPDSKICTPRGFHYNVTRLTDFRKWLIEGNRYIRVFSTMYNGIIDGAEGFSIALGPEAKKRTYRGRPFDYRAYAKKYKEEKDKDKVGQ